MAINTIATAIRTAIADAMADAVDGGAGAGKIRIYTASFAALLCDIDFDDPAFGAAVAGVATAANPPLVGTATGTGTAAVGRITDSSNNVLWQFAIPADFTMSNTSVATDDEISVTALTYTAPGA